ncbi:MAG TPA: indolepyruvate oxidoreductase subunit beta [Phycisphaerae bacterium]|nr:indolepyruvate oxidoreductase subunit beta [Phycisphaerae bacterium]
MEINIILAGVGGQGILTTAQAICIAALRRGLRVKQAEVHGMSQRGGAVESHLRVADHDLYSDLIPLGRADMILAVEPMEALRYVQFLSENGVIIASSNPVVNIPNYGSVEKVLDRVARYPRHVLIDADGLATAAGSVRASNMVMLGVASTLIDIDVDDFEAAIVEMFGRKGPKLIETNRKAFAYGRRAANLYRDGLLRGATSRSVRQWVSSIPADQLETTTAPDPTALSLLELDCELSSAEAQAINQIIEAAYQQGRRQLFEHEVYSVVGLAGAISPPHHVFIPNGMSVTKETLAQFPGNKVVLKVVSPDIVHKSDSGAVVFAPNDREVVAREIDQMLMQQGQHSPKIDGVLIVEFVEHGQSGFGKELFVGIRATREFGPVIAAGLGGVNTEYFAQKLKPGIAVAKALATDTTAEEFFELFKQTAAYEILSGKARGHSRIASDGELMRCFRAFIAIARTFCVDRGDEGPDLQELEVNPFAFKRHTLIPLDGRGRLAPATKRPVARPIQKIRSMLQPRSIAVLGASGKRENFGRIILNNVKDCGFPADHLYVIKEGETTLDGIPCVPTVNDLPEKVDLLVMAAAPKDMPRFFQELIDSGKVTSVIIIPGGLGETAGTEEIQEKIRAVIRASRARPDGGPIFVGGNSLGMRSRPGRFDTFFIQAKKLDPRRQATPRRVGLLSQSGAFIITRMSNIQTLDPTFAISIGNQIDLTVSDMLRALADRDDIDAVGVYVEGFQDLDGVAFVRAVADITAAGKVVVFYKAGRTEAGRSATAGHTASIAGDYDICQSAVEKAGAIVVDTFREFEQILELATDLHGKEVRGPRVGAISNAGYETVGIADAIVGPKHRVELPKLSEKTAATLTRVLAKHKLDRLVNVRNPLDVTPMATDEAWEDCIRALMDDPEIDAIVAAAVPLTPNMQNMPDEIERPGSIAQRLPALFRESTKPMIAVVDSGPPFDELARSIRAAGVPMFRSADEALRSFGRYLCHRAERAAAVKQSRKNASGTNKEPSTLVEG